MVLLDTWVELAATLLELEATFALLVLLLTSAFDVMLANLIDYFLYVHLTPMILNINHTATPLFFPFSVYF